MNHQQCHRCSVPQFKEVSSVGLQQAGIVCNSTGFTAFAMK
ncbi:hypothetical protein Nmel_007670 [Mimus melanotis]